MAIKDGKEEFIRKCINLENKFLTKHGRPHLSDDSPINQNSMALESMIMRYELMFEAISDLIYDHVEIVKLEDGSLDII